MFHLLRPLLEYILVVHDRMMIMNFFRSFYFFVCTFQKR